MHEGIFEITALQKHKASLIPWPKLNGILLDWAGTTIDYGSLAPVEVVREVFRESGVDVSEAEARLPMGKAKIDHLREVVSMPRIAQQWNQRHAQPADERAVHELYQRFLVLQKTVLAKYSELIPGVLEFVSFLREANVRIGTTTGYTRELMDVVQPLAEATGYRPEAVVCSDEVAAGRPAPWSNFRAAELLGIYPMNRLIVVDDSTAGIQAGKHAGCYSVAVTVTGNALGRSLVDLQKMSNADLAARHCQAEAEFYTAGADLVVPSIATLHQLWKAGL